MSAIKVFDKSVKLSSAQWGYECVCVGGWSHMVPKILGKTFCTAIKLCTWEINSNVLVLPETSLYKNLFIVMHQQQCRWSHLWFPGLAVGRPGGITLSQLNLDAVDVIKPFFHS